MHSARLSATKFRRLRRSSTRDLDEEFQDLSLSSSRPSTQESKRSSYSRLSTDSGEGSLEDFSRRNSSPVFFRDGPGRRHTAPIKKSFSPTNDEEQSTRPNTVHAWDSCSPRCSLSRYAPLPAIGSKQQQLGLYELERPVPVRRQCFMGPLDIDSNVGTPDIHKDPTDIHENSADINDNESHDDCESSASKPVFSLTLDSDTDSDFEDESENVTQCDSDVEDNDSKPRRPIIRSATFTIEKERPDVHGPFLTVAVRLPSGIRVAKRFDCKETLQNICEFALQNIEEAQSTKWSLVTTDFPKRIFKDFSMSLKEADIDDKSLLYLQSQDESDSD